MYFPSFLQGYHNIAAVLLTLGLKADALDSHKDSPLHLSAMRGHFGMSEMLLETHSEDKTSALLIPNGAGFTVYHLVCHAIKGEERGKCKHNAIRLLIYTVETLTMMPDL